MIDHRALEIRVLEAPAQHVEQVVVHTSYEPGRAYRVVVLRTRLRGRIPALDDPVSRSPNRSLRVGPAKPIALDERSPRRNGRLLVLGREVLAPHLGLELLELLHGLPFGMQELPHLAMVEAPVAERDLFVLLGDGRQVQVGPLLALVEHVAHEVFDVKTLHDEHDHVFRLAVEARGEGRVVPLGHRGSLHLGHALGGLHGVVDQDQIAAAAREGAADRGAQPVALTGRLDLSLRVLAGIDPGAGEAALIPGALEHGPKIPGVLGRELPGVARADDPQRGIVAQRKGREGHGGTDRLEAPRREGHDQSPDLPPPAALELVGDGLDVPVREVGLPRNHRLEAALREGREIVAHEGFELCAICMGHEDSSGKSVASAGG